MLSALSPKTPTLHMICGKIAAGKSTLARRLADQPNTILISEDVWLSTLYPTNSGRWPSTPATRAACAR